MPDMNIPEASWWAAAIGGASTALAAFLRGKGWRAEAARLARNLHDVRGDAQLAVLRVTRVETEQLGMSARLDRIETTMQQNHRDVVARLDRVIERER